MIYNAEIYAYERTHNHVKQENDLLINRNGGKKSWRKEEIDGF